MSDIEKIEEKKRILQELVNSKSKANCASSHSSGVDVNREMQIEELEEDIQVLEQKVRQNN